MIENPNDLNQNSHQVHSEAPQLPVNGENQNQQANSIPVPSEVSTQPPNINSSAPEQSTDTVTKGLNMWREALQRSSTSAQLAMCLYMLEASIAWDKSIMKAVRDSPLATLLLNRTVTQRAHFEKISVGAC